jgi:histidinol-phosphatase (PHP family)
MPHWTNYHQHCHYCDGTDAPELYIEAAIAQNIGSFGFSSHATVPFDVYWCIKPHRFDEYIQHIRRLQSQYAEQLPIYVGMEIDYIPDMINPKQAQFENLDYRIGSVHFLRPNPELPLFEVDGTHQAYAEGLRNLFENDIRRAAELYYATTRDMVLNYPPDIVGHIDKIKMNNGDNRYFSDEEKWYRQAVMDTLDTIAQTKVVVEVNTRSVYKKKHKQPYPSKWILEAMHQRNIPIMLNSDAHHPREISGEFANTAQMLYDIGFRTLNIITPTGIAPRPFDPNGIYL